MASIIERSGRWRALVRRQGVPQQCRTFASKDEAEAWARSIEARLDQGIVYNFSVLRETQVSDLMKRFRDEVSVNRKGWKWERNRLNALLSTNWAQLRLSDDIASEFRTWRDARVKEVEVSTVIRDFNLMSSVFNHAIKEWGIGMPNNPVKLVKRPSAQGSGERDRLWSEADLAVFIQHFKFHIDKPPQTANDFVPWVLLIARMTGLRLGEICRIKPADVHLDVPCIHFETTKNGDAYDCPLRSDALALFKKLMQHRGDSWRLIEPSSDVIGELYRRARREIAKSHPELGDIVIHSLRHTFTTEMSERIEDKLALLRITGRRSLTSLVRYYKPKAGALAKLMG